jgi:hypothetical protein
MHCPPLGAGILFLEISAYSFDGLVQVKALAFVFCFLFFVSRSILKVFLV